MTYNRATRRVADNAHGNTRHTGPWNPGDNIQRAVYPDPKAAHLMGESAKVQEARALAAPADEPETDVAVDEPEQTPEQKPTPKTTKPRSSSAKT